ncbi:MAG: DUF368 domain-containing protein [Eubacteriales bacterium]|jgi:putative membrane protein
MIKEAADGFCMALADSVPGVSGGTVAFIMGFYDKFIGSIHDLVFGDKEKRIEGIRYLLKLGIGWAIGMGIAVIALNALFEEHIHFISSLFIGFIIGALPIVCMDEAESVRQWKKGILFLILGVVLVAGVTWINTQTSVASMDLADFSPALAIKMILLGMLAISAMFLPGISGSTMLLIFGAYIPLMSSLKELMQLNFDALPAVLMYVVGLVLGAASVVKLIQIGLSRYRPQMIYFILGMMVGSLYAVVMGPTTLDTPQAALNFSNFNLWACLIGVGLVVGMQAAKSHKSKKSARQSQSASVS